MPYVFFALGSNVGDRFANLKAAIAGLGRHFPMTSVSPVYETEPKYDEQQPPFLNAVAKASTSKGVAEVFDLVEQTEKSLGKQKKSKNGPRNIDIDVIFYGDQVYNCGGRIVPHEKMQERAFVLAPLMDVAPGQKHPTLRKTVAELLEALPEKERKKVKKTDLKLGALPSGEKPARKTDLKLQVVEGGVVTVPLAGEAEIVAVSSVEEAEEAIRSVGVEDDYAVKAMAQKAITKVIRLGGVRAPMANILKQEMLSLGGDAAVHRHAVSCKVGRTDVLLIGTLRQLRLLVSKLRAQVAEASGIADAVGNALREYT